MMYFGGLSEKRHLLYNALLRALLIWATVDPSPHSKMHCDHSKVAINACDLVLDSHNFLWTTIRRQKKFTVVVQ